eukprot:1044083-Pyramimonas_sp.AAC.1
MSHRILSCASKPTISINHVHIFPSLSPSPDNITKTSGTDAPLLEGIHLRGGGPGEDAIATDLAHDRPSPKIPFQDAPAGPQKKGAIHGNGDRS